MSVHFTKKPERRQWVSRPGVNRPARPEVHATTSFGDVLKASCPAVVDQAKASIRQSEEQARARFEELESLMIGTFNHLRGSGHYIPGNMLQKAYPAIRVLAGTVGTYDHSKYNRAKVNLEWAVNSPSDYNDMLTIFGLKEVSGK
jgi:hypothetical protein